MNELKGLTLFTKDITQQAKVVRGNEYRTLQKTFSLMHSSLILSFT